MSTAVRNNNQKWHADIVGSFIRPGYLRWARLDRIRGRITDTQLHELEDRAIEDVLALQRGVGLDIYSDGEFRRMFWHTALRESLEGIEFDRELGAPLARAVAEADLEENPEWIIPNPVVMGKLSRKQSLYTREVDFMKLHAPGPFKITLPPPPTARSMMVRGEIYGQWFVEGKTNEFYASREELAATLQAFVLEDVRTAVEGGAAYIQFDQPFFRDFMERRSFDEIGKKGRDADTELSDEVAGTNACLRVAKSSGAATAVHVCFGTYVGGSHDAVNATYTFDPALFGHILSVIEADRFLIEFSPRTNNLSEMESLRFVPKDKTIVLGILNVRDPKLETQDDILRKIEAAAKHIPIEHLALSANCGFAGTAAGAFMSEDMQKQKLELIVATAHKVWGTN